MIKKRKCMLLSRFVLQPQAQLHSLLQFRFPIVLTWYCLFVSRYCLYSY